MIHRLVAALLLASAAHAQEPTKEFELRGDLPYLGGQPVKLWGVRCNNALMSPAVTERLLNNIDMMAEHGVNMIGVSLQGTNGGFPNVDAGPNAFTPDGRIVPAFAKRLEEVIRAADRRGMVVALNLMQPRKDQLISDEAGVRNAIENSGKLLTTRKLRNVFVNVFHEFNHPSRIDHEIFREPDADGKRAKLVGWWKAAAPGIECGICPNRLTGAKPDFPGAEIAFFQNEMPLPKGKFAVNMETDAGDLSGNEGNFNKFQIERMHREFEAYRKLPNAAFLYRSPYIEDVSGVQGTGPNFEIGGGGTGETDRGVKPFYDWMKKNVGKWEYPKHVRP